MPDHETNWNALEKSFDQRRWSSIRTSWPNFVGKPIDPPGCAPELTLSELLEGGGVMTGTPEKGKLTRVRHPRGEITEIIFREAVFWLHKALHVLGASEAHADMGLQNWSLSAAYHSAYFAARAIMAFFG